MPNSGRIHRGRPVDLCNLTNRKERGCPLSLFIYIPKGYLRNPLDNLSPARSMSDNRIGSKTNALIYLRAHYDEISKNEWYAKAYRIMLDEMIRSDYKAIYRDIITKISDEDREMKNRALDMLIETEGKENTENFKDDARFAVEFLKSIYSN